VRAGIGRHSKRERSNYVHQIQRHATCAAERCVAARRSLPGSADRSGTRPGPKGDSQASRSRDREGDRAKAGAPIWRRDEEKGHIYALKLTAAGVKTIAVDEILPSQGEAERRADHSMVSVDPKPEPGSTPAAFVDTANGGVASTLKSPRRGTKIAAVIELLHGSNGVTLVELVANTGWLPHTARAALTGIRKRGYAVVIDRADKGARISLSDRTVGDRRR